MRKLYLECTMGAAGDMLMAALLELHPDKDGFIKRLNDVGIPGVEIKYETVTKCGIQGTDIRVMINGHEENDHIPDHDHDHHNGHHHHGENGNIHGHHHTGMKEIREIIGGLNVSDKVKSDVLAVYNSIAEAESHAHGKSVEQIHFHEIGTMDAVADIVGVSMLIDELNADRIYTSHINVGYGQVKCAHGILPVPAPATAHILQGIPSYSGDVKGELCTPTGAALLKYFTDEFVSGYSMVCNKIGYGMGKRRFYDDEGDEILSSVRAMIGDEESGTDEIIMLSCNIDDMTGEHIGFAAERLFEGGACDVYTTPVYMKKNRPGVLLTVLCHNADKDKIVKLIFRHTTTLGIREMTSKRYMLERQEETAHTEYGDVRVKKSSGFGVVKSKVEYEDLREIALKNNIAIGDIENIN